MKAVSHNINFNLNRLIEEELPIMGAFYESEGDFKQDVKDLFAFPLKNSEAMPFYTVKESSCSNIYGTFAGVYEMLLVALDNLFEEKDSVIQKYFGEAFLKKHPYFLEYAKYTFKRRHAALYGRFDAALDPVSEEVTGVYEFNGDTPVMLFESVNFQDHLTRLVTGSSEAQFNNYYPTAVDFVNRRFGYDRKVAVMFDINYIEDTATCETLSQIIGEKATAFNVGLADIDFENLNTSGSPWYYEDHQLDVIFALCPWEEMVEAFPSGFAQWRRWADDCQFFEPAWRWFISNKGIWAYVTHLFQCDSEFSNEYGELPVLETYMTPDVFKARGEMYVSKPLIGRLSNNIQIHGDGEVKYDSKGSYEGYEVIYQAYHEPHKVEGRNNFILGMWMAPLADLDADAHPLMADPATMAIREFDEPVLSIGNERFIPHLVQ